MLGVDFGSNTIKAVAISGNAENFTIDTWAEIASPKGSIRDFQLQDVDRISQTFKQLLKMLPGKYKNVATAVNGSSVITKITQVASNTNQIDFENIVMMEAEQLIPFPLDEVSLDFEVLGPNTSDPARNDVLICAARSQSIASTMGVFSDSDLNVKVVDVGMHALTRAMVSMEKSLLTTDANKFCAIVDIGELSLSFGIIYQGELVYSRLQDFGGSSLTRSLATFYNLPVEEAENVKLKGALSSYSDIDVVNSYINQLTQHIKRNIQLFCSSSGNRTVDILLLSGGGSLIPGLRQQLALQLEMDVRHPDPVLLYSQQKMTENFGHGAKYMTALGLALRSFTPCQI
jgi:type IV pilus assembly protein PilM